jgi:hypothetical protein
MKISFLALVISFIALTGCNDKPEVQPNNPQILSVYPNPAVYQVNISIGGQVSQPYTIQVFNTKGKVIREEKGNQGQKNYSVNLDNERVGNFQVVLRTGNVVATQKFVKL